MFKSGILSFLIEFILTIILPGLLLWASLSFRGDFHGDSVDDFSVLENLVEAGEENSSRVRALYKLTLIFDLEHPVSLTRKEISCKAQLMVQRLGAISSMLLTTGGLMERKRVLAI